MYYTPRLTLLAAGALLAFSASAANLITNPDFTTGLDGWTVSDGDGTATLDNSTGSPAAPSIQLVAGGTAPNMSVESSCMQIDDSNHVDLYMNINGASGFAIGSISAFSDTACTVGLSAINSDAYAATQAWGTYSMSDVVLPPDTRSAKVVLTAGMGSSTTQGDANFDHIAFGPTGTVTASVNVNQEGLTGTWYNPATSGQGMQFQFSPDNGNPGEGTLFGAWFTYDIVAGPTNSQRWYSIEGSLTGDATSAPVTIFQNTGGNFDAGPVTSAVAVGTGTLLFESCQNGSFAYALDDGRFGTIPLQRLLPNVDCVDAGTPTNPESDFGLSGTWYNPATSGQGMLIEVNPLDGEAFLGWYTYAADGASSGVSGQRWFSAQSPYTVGSIMIDMTIYSSTGGAFDSSGGPVRTDAVGTATLTYTSCASATFDYTFTSGELDGQSGSIPLSRLGATPESCSFHNTQ
jgi:hypothetical protein